MQDSAWFCKIMLNSETFCMFYEKFEAYLPKILLRNYQRLKQTLPIWRYGVQKLNYQRSKLPILKVTNIEVYLYLKNWYCWWLNFFNCDPPVVIFETKFQKLKNGFLVISRSLFWDLVWMWDLRLRTWRSIRRFSHPIHPRLKLERGHITHAAEHYVAPYPNSGWHYKWIISRN